MITILAHKKQWNPFALKMLERLITVTAGHHKTPISVSHLDSVRGADTVVRPKSSAALWVPQLNQFTDAFNAQCARGAMRKCIAHDHEWMFVSSIHAKALVRRFRHFCLERRTSA